MDSRTFYISMVQSTLEIYEVPESIGPLKHLSNECECLPENNDFPITFLKHLKSLRGKIIYRGWTRCQMQCMHGELIKKVISELELEWSDGLAGSQAKALQKEVLIMLKPRNVTLRKLGIMSYGDIEFPNWVGDPSTCTSIPPLGQLPLLKELSIQGTDGLKVVGPEILGYGLAFNSLKHYVFKIWKLPSTNIENVDFVFPCLQEIHIYNCPKLVEVSLEELPSLKILKLHRSSELGIIFILGLTNELWGGVRQHIGPLEEVRLERLDEIRHLRESEAEASKILVNLRTLEVAYCENLVSSRNKEEDTFGSKITSIKTLKISYCNNMDHCNYPDSIEKLAIHKCISMTSSFSYPTGGGSSSRCSFRNVKKSQKMSLEEETRCLSTQACRCLKPNHSQMAKSGIDC
ncbi:LOW QUALITY PROTEIN: hypothetical protein OSB04_011203 [Centaurea solstitialis]|uniref:Uncharacterized protein n=1 Tax=Centaurea solstitialis TaxID=347529 RepID=A0AA38T8Z8_9ASTR|nr:LOW QUALITY PROTEIN: hypothetical protein OSB04_011203 [Centaurea solstitialis]